MPATTAIVGRRKGSSAYVERDHQCVETPADKPMEHPFYYDTVWDLWRLVDVLETCAYVDAKKIGMIGISMGGIQTWLAASVDERVAVAVPLIGVQSFRWSLDNEKWQGRPRPFRLRTTRPPRISASRWSTPRCAASSGAR